MDHKTKVSSLLIALIVIILAILVWGLAMRVSAQGENRLFMPMVYCEGCPPPPTPTKTPKPTATLEPPPTPTPTYIPAEGGNTCALILGAGRNPDGSTSMMAAVPSICSVLVPYQVQLDGQLLIVKAMRIRQDTYGCEEGDFGYWPPVDYSCPPPPEDQIFDEWGRILWGDSEYLQVENSYKIICGYCEECGPPYTANCKEVYIP